MVITFKGREHANLYIKCKWISWSDMYLIFGQFKQIAFWSVEQMTSHDFMYIFRSAKMSNWLSVHYYLSIYYWSLKAKHPCKLFIELKLEKSATKTEKQYMKIMPLLRLYELVLLLQRTIWVFKMKDLMLCFHGMQTF